MKQIIREQCEEDSSSWNGQRAQPLNFTAPWNELWIQFLKKEPYSNIFALRIGVCEKTQKEVPHDLGSHRKLYNNILHEPKQR